MKAVKGFILPALFVVLAACFNASMDKVQFHYTKSIFAEWKDKARFFNPAISWENKWKNGDPDQGERFWGSSTIFVSFTDFWHLAKKGMLTCLALALAFMPAAGRKTRLWVIVAFVVIFSATFEVMWRWVLAT